MISFFDEREIYNMSESNPTPRGPDVIVPADSVAAALAATPNVAGARKDTGPTPQFSPSNIFGSPASSVAAIGILAMGANQYFSTQGTPTTALGWGMFGTSVATTAGTTSSTSTSTQSPINDPALIAILKGLVDQSMNNANDPSKTADVVNDIIRKAQIAFTPTLGAEGRSGLYNSSTVSQLASESVANATSAASSAVLAYKTNQQQLAQQGATSLLNATQGKTTTGTTTGTTAGTTTTNETVAQSGAIPTQASSLLGLGLVGAQAFSQRKKLLDLLGLGGDDLPGGGTQASQDELIGGITPPAFVSEADAISPAISGTFGGSSGALPIFGDEGTLGATSATPFTTGAADLGSTPIVGINSTAEDGGLNFGDLLGNLPDTVSQAASGVGDFLSGIGSSIEDAGEDIIKSIADLFGF